MMAFDFVTESEAAAADAQFAALTGVVILDQSFLSDRKRHVLRCVGGLLYFEASTPAAA
jgi:hypothetical protein